MSLRAKSILALNILDKETRYEDIVAVLFQTAASTREKLLIPRDPRYSLPERSNVIVIYCQSSLTVIVYTACTIAVYS